MTEPVTVVIPVLKGVEWDRDRATNLPPGTSIKIVEYDEPREWAEALTEGVKASDTPLVILSAPDVQWDLHPEDSIEFLADLAWDVDVTYGQMIQWEGEVPVRVYSGDFFCPNRLRRMNYLPTVACVRRDKFLEVGGVTSGLWDLWVRMLDAGARFKYVPEACAGRDGVNEEDVSVVPPTEPLKATFYHQATQGTAYWRCLLPARWLPGMAAFNGPPVGLHDGELIFPHHQGACVFQFCGDESHHELVLALQRAGIRTLVEVDDNYTHFFPQQMRLNQWLKSKTPGRYSVEQHVETVRVADGVIVTSEHLAKQYRPLNGNVFVCPNQIDPNDWEEPKKPGDGVFRIGWFASMSHIRDGDLIRRGLEWASKQPDVEVVMVGIGASNGKPLYDFKFKHKPWSNDFGVYRRHLQELDVGLCPVVGTPWAVCRSDLKTLEYGMAQAYPVVSDQPPYDTVDVPKAKTEKDFLRIIQSLVNDRDGTREKAREWREYVLRERTMEANIDRWENALWKA